MNQSSKTLLWILLALILFAAGFVGFGIYRQKHSEAVQNGPRPALPS